MISSDFNFKVWLPIFFARSSVERQLFDLISELRGAFNKSSTLAESLYREFLAVIGS
jgi:hypothetical protein